MTSRKKIDQKVTKWDYRQWFSGRMRTMGWRVTWGLYDTIHRTNISHCSRELFILVFSSRITRFNLVEIWLPHRDSHTVSVLPSGNLDESKSDWTRVGDESDANNRPKSRLIYRRLLFPVGVLGRNRNNTHYIQKASILRMSISRYRYQVAWIIYITVCGHVSYAILRYIPYRTVRYRLYRVLFFSRPFLPRT